MHAAMLMEQLSSCYTSNSGVNVEVEALAAILV